MIRPDRRTLRFLLGFLAVIVVVAVAVSPFASSSPDGLEKVAADEGFADAAEDHHLAESTFADYGVSGIENERAATGLAGLVGVAITLAVAAVAFGAIRRLRPRDPAEA